jgi:hypothetical protein
VNWALLFALGGTGAVLVGLCIVVLFLRHRINRMHRVHPAVPTDAPLTWLVDPRLPARHHRRLVKVGRTAEAVAADHRPPPRRFRKPDEAPPIVGVAEELRDQAVALDRGLARLAILAPQARRRPLESMGRSIDELERAASALVGLSTEVRTPRALAADDPTLLDVAGQIERLAEAHQALVDLDADAGLVAQPPPGARRTQPAPPPPLTGRQASG